MYINLDGPFELNHQMNVAAKQQQIAENRKLSKKRLHVKGLGDNIEPTASVSATSTKSDK